MAVTLEQVLDKIAESIIESPNINIIRLGNHIDNIGLNKFLSANC